MKIYVAISLFLAVSLVACAGRGAGGQAADTGKTTVKAGAKTNAKATVPLPAVLYTYKIKNSHPHPTWAYTQGLFWHEGEMWESTGEYGRSVLRSADLETGESKKQTALPAEFFGEGSVMVGGNIYLLTWQEGRAFVYDPATLKKIREFSYGGEGWGLTTDGSKLYMSDGSANIAVRNPPDFRAERTIIVRNEGRPVPYLNELEWIDGRIWANVYTTDQVVVIDPADGRVEGIVDFSGLLSEIEIGPGTDVMNGIAHDPATGRVWVTGKNWNRLFEVEIVKK